MSKIMFGIIGVQVKKAHSFPRQILPNSMDHFAKFHGSPHPSICE